jgi:Protein of unknown function (DUF4446)
VQDLTSTTGVVAIAAAAIALVALVVALLIFRRLGRVRADQKAVLGEQGTRDLVAHAAALERGFQALRASVEETASGLHDRLGAAERHLHGAIAYCGLVRYDAYHEMSGRQSTSLALLDASASGIVISSIHHRDQARLYAKQVVEGEGQLELSPEEQEAVRVALAGEVPDRAEQRRR